MTKSEFRAAYREARKQARFILTFRHKLNALDWMHRTFPEQCPGFCFTRLYGDPLRGFGVRRDVECHRSLLPVLRHVRPRLPA